MTESGDGRRRKRITSASWKGLKYRNDSQGMYAAGGGGLFDCGGEREFRVREICPARRDSP
jgi:hypothetical protein